MIPKERGTEGDGKPEKQSLICGVLELFSDYIFFPFFVTFWVRGVMSGIRHEQSTGCGGGGDGEAGILIMPTSTEKYGRIWRRDWTVRTFLALCTKAAASSIPTQDSQQLSRASSASSIQTYNDYGVPFPSSSTVPLLQSEEFENGDSLAQSRMVESGETDIGDSSAQNYMENGSPPSVFQRLQSHRSRASSGRSQSSIDSKTTTVPLTVVGDHGAPSPTTTVPLLLSEEPNAGASSTGSGSHSTMDVPGQPSSTGSNLTLDQNHNASTGTGSPPVLRVQSAQAHLAIDVHSDHNAEDEELENKIARILDEKDRNFVRESGWAQKLASAFDSHLETGKNTGFGESVVVPCKKLVLVKDFPLFFIRASNRYTIILLIISACFSLGFEMVEKSPKKGWYDGAYIFLAALLIVTADSVSSFHQARKQEKKMLKESRTEVTVIRSGVSRSVPSYSTVKGDLLCLERDQTIPADGFLVHGRVEVDGRSDKHIDCNENPFLFSGSMVVASCGESRMLVTSVGSNAVSFKEPALLEARINKPIACAEIFSLCMATLIVVVLFLRFLHRKHDYDYGGPSQIKGEVTVQGVLKIFERMFLKPRGTISILTSSLASVMIGIQHGMPFVISMSLAYWNEKKATEEVEPQNLSACGTMGLGTVICIDISGGLIGEDEASETSMKEAVRTFKIAGVDIKLISGNDGLPSLKDIASRLGIYTTDSTDEAVEGQEIRNLSDDVLNSRVDRIKVMANFLPKDKLSIVQCLKEKGHVVAFYGGSTARDAMVLKAAHVGISDKNSTEMAKKSSDIIISSYRSFNSLIAIFKYGRWAYYNIQKFIQLQLIVMVSSLVITSVATMALRESPITLIQLIWVHLITSILGGLMLITEPHSWELDTLQAAGNRNEPIITKAMWVYILTQILYQASVLLIFLFAILGINIRVRKAIIFNSFALCQVFNYGSAMDLEKKWSNGVMQKGFLLVAVVMAVAVQVLVAEIWARLNWLQWGFCFLVAALSWGLGLAMKVLLPFMPNWSFNHIASHLRHSRWMPSCHGLCFIIFVFPFLILTLFNPDTARALKLVASSSDLTGWSVAQAYLLQ